MASGVWRESGFFCKDVSSSPSTVFYPGVHELHKLDPTYGYKTFMKNPKLGLQRERGGIDLGGVRQVGGSELDQDTSYEILKGLVEILN